MMNELIDSFGRKHDYLRISVTDRCNLRCVYCMGEEGIPWLDHTKILGYEDILGVVEAGAELGIKKIRLTGGEPLVRKHISDLIAKISAVPGIEDISMTTNAQHLAEMAPELKRAGLNRVNISIDSLDPDKFKAITRCGELSKTLEGIQAALDWGLNPVKLNVVLMKGVNDDEIKSFLDLVLNAPLHLRFIEYMPLDTHDKNWKDKYLPLDAVKKVAEEMGHTLIHRNDIKGAGPAEIFTFYGAKGSVGLIHPVSRHFCEECNRLRLTADGFIRPCLYWEEELSVKPFLHDKSKLKELIEKALEYKRQRHAMGQNPPPHEDNLETRGMSKIGG